MGCLAVTIGTSTSSTTVLCSKFPVLWWPERYFVITTTFRPIYWPVKPWRARSEDLWFLVNPLQVPLLFLLPVHSVVDDVSCAPISRCSTPQQPSKGLSCHLTYSAGCLQVVSPDIYQVKTLSLGSVDVRLVPPTVLEAWYRSLECPECRRFFRCSEAVICNFPWMFQGLLVIQHGGTKILEVNSEICQVWILKICFLANWKGEPDTTVVDAVFGFRECGWLVRSPRQHLLSQRYVQGNVTLADIWTT